jgi:hypothetical protein
MAEHAIAGLHGQGIYSYFVLADQATKALTHCQYGFRLASMEPAASPAIIPAHRNEPPKEN